MDAESLSDEVKEAIALANRVRFDPIIEHVKIYYSKYFNIREIAKRCQETSENLNTVIEKYKSLILNLAYIGGDSPMCLELTGDELYFALTLLDKEECRQVLSQQSIDTFSILIDAVERKDKDTFSSCLSKVKVEKLDKLVFFLGKRFEKFMPYEDFLNSLFDSSDALYQFMIGYMADIDEDIYSDYQHIAKALSNNGIFDSIVYEGFAHKLLTIEISFLLGAEDIPYVIKREVRDVYSEWCDALKNPQTITLDSYSDKFSFSFVKVLKELRNQWLLLGIQSQMQESSAKLNDTKLVSKNFNDYGHLEFPSRFVSETTPSQIYAQEQGPILTEIFHVYGGNFEDISCDDFLYLFGATNKMPSTYNPPYYWTGDESTMKALLRVFYTKQPRLLKQLILHTSDKATGAATHDWGRNKNRVAYRDVERNIIGIIKRVAGKTLKEL